MTGQTDAATVAVTGSAGFVGRYVVRELLERGHRVRALVRDPDRAGDALPKGVVTMKGNLLDAGVASRLVDGADACIHLAGILRESGRDTFRRVHIDAVRAVVDACSGAGVRRLVHMSALGARPDGPAQYQRTKYEGERCVMASGLDWTIFRPGLIHGPDGEFVQFVKALASGETAPWLFMPYFVRGVTDDRVPLGPVSWESATVAPVSVEDVAACFVGALSAPDSIGEIYNLVGDDEMTWPELYRILRDTIPGCDTQKHPWHVPATHARVLARAAKAVGLGQVLPFDVGQTFMAAEDSVADTTKARAHLGFEARPFRETVKAYAHRV